MSEYIPASLRQQIYERAGGQCEYCLLPDVAALMPLEADHIIARKHGGQTEVDNLALACSLCNKHKGTDLTSIDPESGDIVPLYHPRRQRWEDHFYLKNARIVPLTATGRVTITLLQLNRPERVVEREILLAAGVIKDDGLLR
jgi:5-methylcytosine-specific restriction endonuclease McrA